MKQQINSDGTEQGDGMAAMLPIERESLIARQKETANLDLKYIRDYYQVDAYLGGRVMYCGGVKVQRGEITGAHGASLKVRMDGENIDKTYHPTWQIKYLSDGPNEHAKETSSDN